MTDITVTYPIYGTFDINRLLRSIKSVLSQTRTRPKIIISEENLESKLEGIGRQFPVVHIFSKPELDFGGNVVYNPGKIRNRAIAKVDSGFIYLNDADVIFKNRNYFFDLLGEIRNDEALIWPTSRRLIQRDVGIFIELVERKGIIKALRNLKFPNEYVANCDGSQHDLKVVKHRNGRLYTTELSTFQRYLSDKSMLGKEPTFWHDVVHIGGIFTRTEMIRSIGGYTNSYITWGYEDVDLQWKLDSIYSTRKMPLSGKFEVLHLDHPKGYFSPEHNVRNKHLFEKRQAEGVEKAILYDLSRLKWN